MKSFRSTLLLLPALLLGSATLIAQNGDDTTTTHPFSDPAKPGLVRVATGTSNLQVVITGTDTDVVTVTSPLRTAGAAARTDGLRLLTESGSLSVTEKDNVITVDAGAEPTSRGGTLTVTVPRATAISVKNSLNGSIRVSGVEGDLEIKSLNGRVVLEDIAGGALVESMNGGIEARVSRLQENKPLSFTSMNGAIALWVPGEAKANVRLRTQHGAILTDFDEQKLVTRTESLRGYRYTMVSGDNEEIRETVREAVRLGVEAAREAAEAMREAAQAAREAAREVRTDSPANAPRAPRAPLPPLPPMTGGKLVSGTLNGGGGTEIHATAMNGDIKLRKAD
ncbi:MAG: DUF4097 family beta strand repeat protein [Opitutaceae bacterium]|nr:DUF4097 family beta strand repeat protein [Opitutaceae bacterium]